MKIAALAAMILGIAALGACTSDNPVSSNNASAAFAHSPNGSAGQRPAYFDDELYIVNMKELSDDAAEQIEESNQTIADIYASNDLDEEQDFISVIDGVPGTEEFSPLWEQFLIVFN